MIIFAKEWKGSSGRYIDCFMQFRNIVSKRCIAKQSYAIEIHSEIVALFHILVPHDPNTGENVLKYAVYIFDNNCKRMCVCVCVCVWGGGGGGGGELLLS